MDADEVGSAMAGRRRAAGLERSHAWSTAMAGACLVVASIGLGDEAAADGHRPEVLTVVRDKAIVEASGVAADPDSSALFVIQDAGTGSSEVFAIGPDGETALTLGIPGIENEDWEDLAIGVDEAGQPAIFVGDIGDAYFVRRDQRLGPRSEYSVLRVAKPTVDVDAEGQRVEATDVRRWRFVYADRASHNAESLLVQPGTNRLFVVDKTEQDDDEAAVWVAPAELDPVGVNTFERVATIPVTGASGASFSPNGDRLVVRNADRAYLWAIADGDVAAALQTPPTEVVLPPQRQGEGIDFLPAGTALVANSEGGTQAMYRVPLPVEIGGGPPVDGEPSTKAAPTGPPAADLAGSREVPAAVLFGAAGWVVAVIGAIALWRRRNPRT